MILNAEMWNSMYPVGTRVRYWPLMGEPEHEDTKTRSKAWDLDSGYTIVSCEGRAGGLHVKHLMPLAPVDVRTIRIWLSNIKENLGDAQNWIYEIEAELEGAEQT